MKRSGKLKHSLMLILATRVDAKHNFYWIRIICYFYHIYYINDIMFLNAVTQLREQGMDCHVGKMIDNSGHDAKVGV